MKATPDIAIFDELRKQVRNLGEPLASIAGRADVDRTTLAHFLSGRRLGFAATVRVAGAVGKQIEIN